MQGDFSNLDFDPHAHERGVAPAANGVLRNVNGVLHQQGRVSLDTDFTDGQLLELGWQAQAGRDVIGAGVCAVPADEADGFKVQSAAVVNGQVHVQLHPGRAWADGILARLAGAAADPAALVERTATYFGPPLSSPLPSSPLPTPDSIDDGVRDAVILEVSEESLHGFQYPERLIEPALGGPDTTERAYVNYRIRLLRLGADEDCDTIRAKLRDDLSAKGRLTASLAPVIAIAGDCPVVGGGGYTGFEHNLYRIEIAETSQGTARFKWSQWNGGLAARGRFDATVNPPRVTLDAGRAAVIHSGLNAFYLEALQYDEAIGAWQPSYGAMATLTTDHDLELAVPPVFGALPSTTDSVFFRLWNGIADVAAFTNAVDPVELRDGIRLQFDAPGAGNYRPGDYWTFAVRAGEIANPAVLVDDAPPTGIVYHRVALAEIDWTGRRNTDISGAIEDCRKRFRPLTNQKICCTFLVGDGVSSFGDFNALEEAARHLPLAGGELCLLPGLHRANLALTGRRNVVVHGCARRSIVLPRTDTRTQPILSFTDCDGIEVRELDLVTYDGIAIAIEGTAEGSCRDLRVHGCRVIARTNAIRATQAAELKIDDNRLHLLDTVDGRATISINADDVLIERNTLVLLPFVDDTPDDPDTPDDDPTRDPADPCARPQVIYRFPKLVLLYAFKVWAFALVKLVPRQPYRAFGGIHVRQGSERVRIVQNRIVGGGGNGITLGGDIDPPPPVIIERANPGNVTGGSLSASLSTASFATAAAAAAPDAPGAAVNVTANGQFLALVQDEKGKPVPDVDVYLEADTTATDRSDAQGMASVKTAAGAYTLDVSPQYRVLRVAEARDADGVLVNAVTVAPRAVDVAAAKRGFLHEIGIEGNDVSMMGLSGIGFALRDGATLAAKTPAIPANDPKGALLAYIDAAILNLGLTPLLRATDPVRDLVVLANRLHHNLRNPFTDPMVKDAQSIGRGGVSLAIVESAVLSGNHVYENGASLIDPVCGVFVGYGNDLEMTDNVLAANGPVGTAADDNRRAGLRGGFYVRFAGALTSQASTATGRKPALRVHDNRVDQPAGRALTAYAFGPVSVANNHLNSEFSGRFGLLDTVVGGVLLFNLGGIHRLLARTLGKYFDNANAYAARAEAVLPGGETLFDDNYVRLGSVNRSLVSQALLCFDDLGYSANTASVFRREPFLANAVLMGDTVRVTGSRFREDANHTISALTQGFRTNITTLNQADHCIVARPARVGANPLPTIDTANQVLDAAFCDRTFGNAAGLSQFATQSLSANARELGGALPDNAFTTAEMAGLSRQYAARSMAVANETHVATTQAYSYEAQRLAVKLGADHPMAQALRSQADAGAQTAQLIASSAEVATVQVAAPVEGGSALGGRFVNARGQGQQGYVVGLLRGNGTQIEVVGTTDEAGAFSAVYDPKQTAVLQKEGDLFLRVTDAAGKQEIVRSKEPVRLAPGANVQVTLTGPVRIVPKSVALDGTVIFGTRTTPATPATPPAPPAPTPPAPTPPAPQPPAPPSDTVRTPLDKLDIDAATRKRLNEAGVRDVEGVLEIAPAKLADALGDKQLATTLIERAKRLLASQPGPVKTARKRAPKKNP
ncbi:hypothetical protein QTI51_01750 [Variovorax sp. J22G73]|uniref:Ig-like domain-containing protein n=1 Tax=unclassified Variovorax TaxID=663243 RepID=UPI000D5E5C1F|nr:MULTISPECIES: Ig-like domain-containing protein [unclassified Variovorax]MDM0004352.1 hypothetical protein [Variovorax sp. J22R203]MDM0095982.1 hypothetical protein [Variovorax sp. J22G73]